MLILNLSSINIVILSRNSYINPLINKSNYLDFKHSHFIHLRMEDSPAGLLSQAGDDQAPVLLQVALHAQESLEGLVFWKLPQIYEQLVRSENWWQMGDWVSYSYPILIKFLDPAGTLRLLESEYNDKNQNLNMKIMNKRKFKSENNINKRSLNLNLMIKMEVWIWQWRWMPPHQSLFYHANVTTQWKGLE